MKDKDMGIDEFFADLCESGRRFARHVEAGVRKDDEALIRQMLEAVDLGKKLALTGGVFTTPELALLTAASTAATARLEKAP
jgi:hypothetical protein